MHITHHPGLHIYCKYIHTHTRLNPRYQSAVVVDDVSDGLSPGHTLVQGEHGLQTLCRGHGHVPDPAVDLPLEGLGGGVREAAADLRGQVVAVRVLITDNGE